MKNKAKNMTIEERNTYVDVLIQKIKNNNVEAKLELFNIILKLFKAKSFNDREETNKDLQQDLWFQYEKALTKYDYTSPFLSYIYNYFNSLFYDNMNVYNSVVLVPRHAQYKKNMEPGYGQELDEDMFGGEVSLNAIEDKIEDEYIQRKINLLLGKLKKPLHQTIIKLEFGIIDINEDNPTQTTISEWLYKNGHTKKILTRERIRQIIKESLSVMGEN
jgi:hypothetical protein